MKASRAVFWSVSLLLVSVVSTCIAEESLWLTDFGKAQEEAAKRDVPILVNFSGSDWCGWCIRLDKEIFSKDAFLAYAKENLVLFNADFPSKTKLPEATGKQNKALQKKYKIQGFPSVLILDSKGSVTGKTGYRKGGPDAYVQHLRELMEKAQ